MSYRNEWRMAIIGEKEKVTSFVKDIRNVAKFLGFSEITEHMFENTVIDYYDDFMELGESSARCYDPWDKAISFILTVATEADGLDVAYMRLGERDDDNEEVSSNPDYIYTISRYIGDLCY